MNNVAGKIIRSRLAPTPSGYLHLGNAVNFIRTWLLVRKLGGRLKLRIDDLDCDRCRPEYIEDIFRQLDWLGLDWDEGPAGPDDFVRRHSQRLRLDRYREELENLLVRAPVFACTCSRKQIREHSTTGLYPGTCRGERPRPAAPHALRVAVEPGTLVRVDNREVELAQVMGDFLIWRRDGLPAYQLASLVDDLDDRTNLIVRGQDLLASTAAQIFLAEKLGKTEFSRVAFHHHPLLSGVDGRKLSKSDDALSLTALRSQGKQPLLAYRAAAGQLALEPGEIFSLDDLLAGYSDLGPQ